MNAKVLVISMIVESTKQREYDPRRMNQFVDWLKGIK